MYVLRGILPRKQAQGDQNPKPIQFIITEEMQQMLS